MAAFATLALATLVSEDLACLAAGLLIHRGQMSALSAIGACVLGIFAGDVGLWAAGRVGGRAALAWPVTSRLLQSRQAHYCRTWLDHHAGRAIIASRFLPGTRLPLYLVAGLAGLPGGVFALWAFVGTVIWTPALVLLSAALGTGAGSLFQPTAGPVWLTDLAAVVAGILLLRAIRSRRVLRVV